MKSTPVSQEQILKKEYDKMIADMEHDLEQRNHWKAQKYIWFGTVLMGIIAISFNGYAQIELIKVQNTKVVTEKK